MSNALLEALSSGLAVVATRVGAAEALIRDRKQSLLVAPGDVEGLASALRELLEDGRLRESLGKAAPGAVEDLGIEAVVEKIEAVYRETVRP
jgi:glycosyltransferase involved in cell wall biosynthesis